MSILDFLALLWRRKWIVMTTAAITLLAVSARTAALEPRYRSQAVVRVATSSIGSFEYLQYDITYTDRLMNTYKHLATSGPVLSRLVERLNLGSMPSISVEPLEDTELMVISVEDTDPDRAALVANTLAEELIGYLDDMNIDSGPTVSEILRTQLDQVQEDLDEARAAYTQLASLYADTDERVIAANRAMLLQEQIYATLLDQYEGARAGELVRANSLTVVDPAQVPSSPSSPNIPLNLGLGALLGLVAGLGLAIVVENSDTTLYTSAAIQKAVESEVLGMIPVSRSNKLLTFSNGSSPQAEAYRSLRTTLFGLRNEVGLRSLVFTSAVPNEGKSTVVANLATAIAQSGRTVIVVDCDLRRPSLERIFGVSSDFGLVNLLRKEVEPWEVMVHTEHPNLTLVTTGQPLPANPSEVLTSLPFAEVLKELLRHADIVIIDAPALGPVTDAAIIAPLVDAAILVVGRGRVKEEEMRVAYRKLLQVKARNVGIIINRAERVASYTH